jgi:Arc/MetJ-type ribon-helix-helix transcriptional regulator
MTGDTKIAISLPLRAAETARNAVKAGRATSVSAYIAEAVEQHGKQEDLAAVLDEMLAETGGSLTDAERRAADRALGYKPRKRRTRR